MVSVGAFSKAIPLLHAVAVTADLTELPAHLVSSLVLVIRLTCNMLMSVRPLRTGWRGAGAGTADPSRFVYIPFPFQHFSRDWFYSSGGIPMAIARSPAAACVEHRPHSSSAGAAGLSCSHFVAAPTHGSPVGSIWIDPGWGGGGAGAGVADLAAVRVAAAQQAGGGLPAAGRPGEAASALRPGRLRDSHQVRRHVGGASRPLPPARHHRWLPGCYCAIDHRQQGRERQSTLPA